MRSEPERWLRPSRIRVKCFKNLNYWNNFIITGFHIFPGELPDRTPKTSSAAGGEFLPASLLVIRGISESQL